MIQKDDFGNIKRISLTQLIKCGFFLKRLKSMQNPWKF
ncbi:hypothetical protein LEP1GSC125_0473 [Leptospira mayottensis 200901122]|uniref:Uncharacterized protein n=1 Tax=Leptospira mayottensis 200901122 TaxID=1193010 RepID=A0AA87SYK7_9LEPT|nr:hypothetical protein LEP1GSC125_0473 [Leptospira mayottensis 200901122]